MDHFVALKNWGVVPERTYDAAFLCWLIDSINRPEEEPGVKMAASGVLDMILQEDRPNQYSCVEILSFYGEVPAIAVVNHTVPVILETGLLDRELFERVAKVKHNLLLGLYPAFTERFSRVYAVAFDLRYRESGIGKDVIYDSVDVVISPEDLLTCMCVQPTPKEETYQIYLSYLQDLVQKRSMCKSKEISQWDRFCYYGYFSALEKKLPQPGTGWGSRSTIYGLQRWFGWNASDQDGYDVMKLDKNLLRLYFQIEIMQGHCELCVKCKSIPKKMILTQTLWELCEAFQSAFQEKGYDCRKKRFLGGQFTSVCAVEFEPKNQSDIIEAANEVYQVVVPKLIAEKSMKSIEP